MHPGPWGSSSARTTLSAAPCQPLHLHPQRTGYTTDGMGQVSGVRVSDRAEIWGWGKAGDPSIPRWD